MADINTIINDYINKNDYILDEIVECEQGSFLVRCKDREGKDATFSIDRYTNYYIIATLSDVTVYFYKRNILLERLEELKMYNPDYQYVIHQNSDGSYYITKRRQDSDIRLTEDISGDIDKTQVNDYLRDNHMLPVQI